MYPVTNEVKLLNKIGGLCYKTVIYLLGGNMLHI